MNNTNYLSGLFRMPFLPSVCIVVLTLVAGTPQAFSQAFFAIQWEVAEPTETFKQTAATGFGGKLTYIYFVSPRVAITGSTGYTKWGPRIEAPPYTDYKLVSVPVGLGIRLLFTRGIVTPYVGVAAGMDYLRSRGVAPGDPSGVYHDKSELRFSVSPHLGVGIHVFGPVGFMVSGSYRVLFTDPQAKLFTLGLGIAVGL